MTLDIIAYNSIQKALFDDCSYLYMCQAHHYIQHTCGFNEESDLRILA